MIFRRTAALVCSVLLSSLARAEESHTFKYVPDPKDAVKSVAVAGDFNGWSTFANPMKLSGGVFQATVALTEGIHHYKFVLNGSQWVPDPKYSDKELEKGDNYGGVNSAILVGPDARKLPAPKPDAVNPGGIKFDETSAADVSAAGDNLLRLRVRTQADDVQHVYVHFGKNGTAAWPRQEMDKVATAMGYDVYSTVLQVPTELAGDGDRVQYYFEFRDGSKSVDYARGAMRDTDAGARPVAMAASLRPAFTTPDWAKDAVWYQIFPERFRNGDPSNDPPNTKPWTSDWFSTLPGEAAGSENFYKGKGNVWKRRYGGDVQGLRQSLPYLKKLGITAIYLNPMFEAESMHKYDATDYRHIDEFFGVKGDYPALLASGKETDDPKTWTWTPSDKLFLDFVADAHAQGFKVILDGVFNHVGRNNWAFQDVLKKGKSSKYASWFDVRDWNQPIKYIAWDKGGEATNDGALPVFKKDEKLGLVHGPREHIFAVTRRWLAPDGDPSRGVDGFRLDVPGDIPHPFWVEWRTVVKQTKPDAYIAGEIWDWAQPWLKGDQFDAVMNYRFADAAQQFFVNRQKAIAPSDFAARSAEMINAYPLQVSLVQMNLFDSHDTDRFASMFVNPDLAYDASNRLQDNGPNYSPAKPSAEQWTRMEQAVTYQMTFVGAPMIYYGDEAGMWGPDDPSNRQPMLWEDLQPYADARVTFNAPLFAHYQRLIAIRESLKPLRWGYYRPILADDKAGVLLFGRTLNHQAVYIALNRSSERQTVAVPTTQPLLNYLDPASAAVTQAGDGRPVVAPSKNARPLIPTDGTIRVTLEPYGSAILAPVDH